MAVINMLFFIIFCHFTKTEKTEIKTKFSELICENDGCENKDNHMFLNNSSFEENEFSPKSNEQSEERSTFFTDHLRSDINSGNGDKLVKSDLELNSPIVEMTKFNSNSNNSRDSYLTASMTNVETDDISPVNTDVKRGVIKNEGHSELNGSYSSENTSLDSYHLDNTVEITTEIASPRKTNFTDAQSNSTNLFPVQNENSSKKFLKNTTAVCICNLKVDECDINCCCDEDCTLSMKQVFSHCADLKDVSAFGTENHCLNFKSILKNNAVGMEMSHEDGLLCIVKNNFKINAPFNVGQIIQNTTNFQKRITGKKFYKYSEVHAVEQKMSNSSYQIGDYLWAVVNKGLVTFGVPHYHVNKKCDHLQNMRFLTEYSTECLYSVPGNRNSCEKASQLEMKYFLRNGKVIKSPSFVKNQNSSDICDNNTCAEISTYTCVESLKISSCIKTSPRRLLWDKDYCKNIVLSVEYHFFHNGTEGIKEVKAYFTLGNLSSTTDSYFLQKIKLKYFWAEMPVQAFVRSGNPGYVIGKAIMAGRKIFNDNETSVQKKEAIDLSGNPEYWLSAAGSKKGICTFDKRDALNFGENLVHGCLISLNEYDLTKRKCVDLQEIIFKFLIGDEYVNIKTNNKFNKYVATFGNSRVEETGDWVQVIIDTLPIVSSQPSVTVLNDIIVCKNMVTELFINIAYSKIGSFKNPQNKILGVQFYFGSSKNIIYSKEYKYSDAKASGMVKISTFVHFIDLSTRPQAEFAETPGFEAKLPHDFFYPFFSSGSLAIHQNTVITFFLVVSTFFC